MRHDLGVDQARWQREVDPEQAFAVLDDLLRARGDALSAELDALE